MRRYPIEVDRLPPCDRFQPAGDADPAATADGATHLAHSLSAAFPDGALFVDLHGFTEGIDPITTSDGLGRVLRALGVPENETPELAGGRAAMLRTWMAQRRTSCSTTRQVQATDLTARARVRGVVARGEAAAPAVAASI
jgi:hypothetical protein